MQVVARIVGESSLPWEGGGAGGAGGAGGVRLLQSAGRLRGAVLELLRRDPLPRLPVDGFLAACARVLASTTQHTAQSEHTRSSAA